MRRYVSASVSAKLWSVAPPAILAACFARNPFASSLLHHRSLRTWFEEIVSLDGGGHIGVGGTGQLEPAPPLSPGTSTKGSRILTEARLMMSSEGWDDAGLTSFPEVIIERLWAVADNVFSSDSPPSLAAEAAQYRFLSLLAEVSEDRERITDLLSRLKECDERCDRSSSELMRLVRELRDATVPLYQRWLQQSAFTSTVYGAEMERGLPGMTRLIQLRQHLLQAKKLLAKRMKDGSVILVAPKGTADCVKWSEDVKAAMERVDSTVFSLLRGWMRNGSGMELSELRWDTTPPSTLEMVIAAESVHPFPYPELGSMRQRLQPAAPGSTCRRHLYCFLHREAPNLPLIAVQVALWNGVASSVDDVLQRPKAYSRLVEEEEDVVDGCSSTTDGVSNTAIFYSINNVQPGLHGVALGSTLIKTVVARLEQDAGSLQRLTPPIAHYSTLSPIPGFMAWFKATAAQLMDGSSRTLADAIIGTNSPLFGMADHHTDASFPLRPIGTPRVHELVGDVVLALKATKDGNSKDVPVDADTLLRVLFTILDETEWWHNPEAVRHLKRPLMRAIACYLTQMRKRGRAMDSVTNFHVGNGAELFRINWMGNQTAKGSAESCCAMVNYYYDNKTLSTNALQYQSNGTIPLGLPIRRQIANM